IDAPRPELYDVVSDPHELKNLYSTQRAIANEMRRRLGQLIAQYTPAAAVKTAEATGLDPALMERLKSLGYVAVSGGGDEVLSDRRLADPKDRIQVYELVSDALAESQRGRYAESIAKLIEAGKMEKNSLPIHYLLALNYYRQKNFPSAVAEFQLTLKLSPDYALANYYLCLSYAQTHAWDQAVASFRRTLNLDATNYSPAYNLCAFFMKQVNAEYAESAFRQFINSNSNYAHENETHGELLTYRGKLDEDIPSLHTAVQIEPGYAQLSGALIKSLEANGQASEVEE